MDKLESTEVFRTIFGSELTMNVSYLLSTDSYIRLQNKLDIRTCNTTTRLINSKWAERDSNLQTGGLNMNTKPP